MRGGGGGEGELGTISSELVLWVSTAVEQEQREVTMGIRNLPFETLMKANTAD